METSVVDGFVTDLQRVQYLDKYAKWNDQLGRRETWPETVERVIHFLHNTLDNYCLTHHVEWPDGLDIAKLKDAMLRLDVLPSMRVVQMAGPALERCNVGAYNCAYLPLDSWRAFGELLYILMQGTGVGFSVEQQYVDRLPVIVPPQDPPAPGAHLVNHYRIDDSTEGWCDALVLGLSLWANGQDVVFDYSQIRPYGAPLKTKGGKASGPEPLKNLLEFARTMLLRHRGRKLSSLNLHDLACYCGSIVQVGGVRRAAEISLSDFGDVKMAKAKQGQFWQQAPERMMANNSSVYTKRPNILAWMEEWKQLMMSGTGERGVFNREAAMGTMPARRSQVDWVGNPIHMGLNPCGEIILRPRQFCNLSIAVARPADKIADLERKVRLAAQFGIVQSLLTKFHYINLDWKENCEDERLLGVDITGQMDNACLAEPHTAEVAYGVCQKAAVAEADRLSGLLGINMPAAVTCVKPSGNSSQLLNCSSGIHPRYAKYYIRRLRIGASSPIAQLLIESGVPHFPEVGQPPDSPTIWVFEFPVKSPEGAVCRGDRTAIQQLEQWLACKIHYTEHNPSCTVYVKEDEWMKVGAWVYEHWDEVGGLSFLPYDGGVYQLAPYEECTPEEYERRTRQWPKIDFDRLSSMEHGDSTELNREFACSGDKCEI